MKIRKPITSTPTSTTLLDHHHHHQEIKSDHNIQESDRAAEFPSSSEDVDTRLSLDSAADIHVADRHKAVTMINLAKFRNDIDFLGLGITADNCSRNYNEVDGPADDHNRRVNPKPDVNLVLNPMPLRSYHPAYGYMYYYSTDHHHHQDQASSSTTSCAGKKRKREQNNNNNTVNAKKGGKRSKVDEYPEPINPPQELVQRIGPKTRPVFLYRKQLVKWDTLKHQNRLFVYDAEKLMDFLTEEESRAVEEDKVGIYVVAMDRMGREYKLHLTKWESSDKPVLKKDWNKIVDDNRAEKGDWVHLWAYRRGEADQFCLYVDLRKQP